MNNVLVDKRFNFLIEIGCSVECINEHIEKWNQSVIDNAADLTVREMFVENVKYLLSETKNENLTLYMFFLYTDAFLYEQETFKQKIIINLEKTMERLFGKGEGIVALYGKGKNIILKQITK